jgi:hypothetical protein
VTGQDYGFMIAAALLLGGLLALAPHIGRCKGGVLVGLQVLYLAVLWPK